MVDSILCRITVLELFVPENSGFFLDKPEILGYSYDRNQIPDMKNLNGEIIWICEIGDFL